MSLEYTALAERIARLEQAEKDTRSDITEIKLDVKSILNTLAQMSGGKKAVLGLFTLLGGFVGIVGTMLSGKIH